MEFTKNKFKAVLDKGDPTYGIWIGVPDSIVAEIAAGAGFDWLLIDGEHAPYDVRGIMSQLQAIAAYDVAPIVRVVEGQTALLKQILDIGAQSVLVPMVDTAEQAREIVRAVKYPPQGIRGLGTALARAADWGRTPGYLHKANDEICVIVQAETTKAVENLDEILAVDGVDGVFFGPADLSASMGYVGDASNPAVIKAICDGLEKTRKAGKYAGTLCMDPTLTKQYVAAGAQFVGIGVDTVMLASATSKLAQQYKAGTTAEDDKPQAGY